MCGKTAREKIDGVEHRDETDDGNAADVDMFRHGSPIRALLQTRNNDGLQRV